MSDDKGTAEAGVDVSKSVYEMKESLFDGFFGDGGACDDSVALVVGVAAPGDAGPERVCNGCSWCVAVVGDELSEVMEKLAEVGVAMVGAVVMEGECVCTTGRVGGELVPDGACVWDWGCNTGSGRVKLGLGDGRFARTLRRFDSPLGLGLRLLI